MELILIAAMSRNRVIGHNNTIPWHIPEEMYHFKKCTMGHAVIMGRKTFASIGNALPGRFNVVLSKNKTLHIPGCTLAHTLAEGIQLCQDQEKTFIIGGRAVYQESLELVDTIILSILDREYEGDTFFPSLPKKHFQEISAKRMGNEQPFTLHTYQRISAA
ncbi:MAG: dihydrofolate reductase [Desulfocapsa sp.]|nr:dihydrofolate reductase [Desulfocapsa sp.]